MRAGEAKLREHVRDAAFQWLVARMARCPPAPVARWIFALQFLVTVSRVLRKMLLFVMTVSRVVRSIWSFWMTVSRVLRKRFN